VHLSAGVSAEEYFCSAEEYFKQNSLNGSAPVLVKCGVYWPDKNLENTEIVKIGMPELHIKGAIELRDEEVRPFRRINKNKDFIIVSEEQVWSEESAWCGRVSDVYTLNLGPGGVPENLLSGYALLTLDTVLLAESHGGYQLVGYDSIKGNLDDFVRVGNKIIIFDTDKALMIKLAEQYREFMSRGVFFSSISVEKYTARKKLFQLSAKTYSQTPEKYTCKR